MPETTELGWQSGRRAAASRKLEQATYDMVAFRFIAANDHPNHDTIAAFRRRFLKEIEALFVRGSCNFYRTRWVWRPCPCG